MRHRSGEEEQESKRGRITSSHQQDPLKIPGFSSALVKMDQGTFIRKMELALSNERLAGLFVGLFERYITKTIENISNRVDIHEEKGTEKDKQIDNIEYKPDEVEQRRMENNIIVIELKTNQTMKDTLKKLLNEKLKCNIKGDHIIYTLKLKKEGMEARGQLT